MPNYLSLLSCSTSMVVMLSNLFCLSFIIFFLTISHDVTPLNPSIELLNLTDLRIFRAQEDINRRVNIILYYSHHKPPRSGHTVTLQ